MRPEVRIFQAHVARAAIGASTVRGKGNAGVAHAARDFCSKLSLPSFEVKSESQFLAALDVSTTALEASLPIGARHWGLARKCLNIFLRDAFYNRFISEPLLACEAWLEVPLDNIVASSLVLRDPALPKWPGVKDVKADLSIKYQESASTLARECGCARVYLDSGIWGLRGVWPN